MAKRHVARKRFGQHFLVDQQMIERIVQVFHPTREQHCVEIGPGLGALTDQLLGQVSHLSVVEIDRDLCARLRARYGDQITVIEQDVLKVNFKDFARKPLRIIGNLPYNISTPLIFHLLDFFPDIQDLLFMLQKEVVDRMVASPGTSAYGRLSVMLQACCRVQKLFDVPPEAFDLPPAVWSSIVRVTPISELPSAHSSQIVATAFNQRRKTLKRSLSSLLSQDIFEAADVDPRRRPEELSVEAFKRLAEQPRGV